MFARVEAYLAQRLSNYLGVEGGVLLRGARARQLGQKYPLFAKFNNGSIDCSPNCLIHFIDSTPGCTTVQMGIGNHSVDQHPQWKSL